MTWTWQLKLLTTFEVRRVRLTRDATLPSGVRLDPRMASYPFVRSHIVMSHYIEGDYATTVAEAKRLVTDHPDHPYAYRWLAAALGQLGRTDEAIEAIERGMQAAPRLPDLPILLGWIFHGKNDNPRARSAFAHVLASFPNHADAHYGMGLVLMDAATAVYHCSIAAEPTE